MINLYFEETVDDKDYMNKATELHDKCMERRREEIRRVMREKNVPINKVILIDYIGYPVFINKPLPLRRYILICKDKFIVRLKTYGDKSARQLTEDKEFNGVWRIVRSDVNMKEYKVFGGSSMFIGGIQQRMIIATKTKKEAMGKLRISRNEFNNYWCQTGNSIEVKVAMSKPGTIFVVPLDEPHKKFKEFKK